jgi:hypothetical protein
MSMHFQCLPSKAYILLLGFIKHFQGKFQQQKTPKILASQEDIKFYPR